VIVFCGVRFMAEGAFILNPGKQVLIPDMDAGCSLEDSCPPDEFAQFRAQYPDHMVVTYINCSARIKAMSDIIVTSSNAEAIINQLPKDQKLYLRRINIWAATSIKNRPQYGIVEWHLYGA
jgi:quinolinate synthase